MRPLLVLTRQELPDDLRQVLASAHWAPMSTREPEEALAAAAEHDIYVGLALFPPDTEPGQLAACIRLIYALPGLRWVASMTRRQAGLPSVKQLIVERLYDYQVEPVEPLRLCYALGHAHGIAQIEKDLLSGGNGDDARGRFGMIGISPVMRSLYETIDRVAGTDACLLIVGPTGTGKELVASAIHTRSRRAAAPLVSLSCAAIPSTLIQSELFGYTRGAFTGARKSKPGLIESAAGGTLFLDEIGEMPLESQASLLRFLDDRRIRPMGAEETKQVDVRIIAATNRDIEDEAEREQFRADLYYRLAVLTLRTPALKARGDDVALLAEHFLQDARTRFSAVPIGLARGALAALRRHDWPGNVRELRSRVYQAAINCERRYIEPADLGLAEQGIADEAPRPLAEVRDKAERAALQNALRSNAGNVTQAAKTLRISRMTMYRMMEKHGLGGEAS